MAHLVSYQDLNTIYISLDLLIITLILLMESIEDNQVKISSIKVRERAKQIVELLSND